MRGSRLKKKMGNRSSKLFLKCEQKERGLPRLPENVRWKVKRSKQREASRTIQEEYEKGIEELDSV